MAYDVAWVLINGNFSLEVKISKTGLFIRTLKEES